MKQLKLILGLLILVLTDFPGTAYGSNDGAESRLKASVQEVVAVVKTSPNRDALIAAIKPVVQNILNFGVMSRRSIGPGWKQLSAQQQQEATKLFTTLILRTYTAKFTPGECPGVEYKPSSSPAPGRVDIPTTSLYKGSRYEVIYRMEDQNGLWSITDVNIEGVSMVANYRSQFDAEFKRGGADAVLNALRRSVAESK